MTTETLQELEARDLYIRECICKAFEADDHAAVAEMKEELANVRKQIAAMKGHH